MTRSVAGLAVVTFLAGGSALAQSATFSRADYLSLGNNHVIADLNGDGKPDIAGIGPMSAAVMLGNGDGTFAARTLYPVATWAQDLAAGDLDGDGRLDLVVTINDPQVSLSLLFGNGDGTFGAPVNIPNTSGYDTPAVVTTDLNGDGRLDLVLGHQMSCFTAPCTVSQIIAVMLGNGDGTFQPPDEIFVGTATARIAVGDFDRDGAKDLALASDRSRVHVLLGAGDGTFRSQTTLTLIPENNIGMDCTDIDVADLDGDGLQDLVVAVALNGSRTAILLGNGDGTFRPPHLITEPAIRIPHYQAIADYNGDGFLDLALSLGWGGEGLFEILNGRGDGTFQAPVLYLRPPDRSSISGFAIVAGDFNGDGKPDLALGIVGASPAFAALTNTTGQAPPPTPSAPTLLSPANDASPAQPVTFDWSDVNAATAYRIQIDDSSNFSTPLVADRLVTPSQFTASTLAARRHWWRVRGINSAGVAGPWSTVRRFTPGSTTTTGPTLSSIVLAPTSVAGGSGSQGTATLSSAAPAGGAVVPLTSSNPAVGSAPSSVTVPAGSTSASFAVTTTQVTSLTGVTFTGTYGGVSRSATLTVTPPPAPASLNAVSVSPTSVVGGSSSQGIVGLTAAAPAGGFTVALSSSNAAATVPASVTVAAGAPSATFGVTTTQVAASTAVTITATAGGVSRTTTLTVTPPQQTATATLTVTASGRSGERVVSSPAGVNVSVGSTGSASFTTGTSIALSVSNGRDAIWSGACSSGGNKTRTCTFTLQANASVTANVQ